MINARRKTSRRHLTADEIGELASRGKDVSKYFTNKFTLMPAIRSVDVDFTEDMLTELDEVVRELNVSRQAVIKTLLRQSLDLRTLARRQAAQKPTKLGPINARLDKLAVKDIEKALKGKKSSYARV
jgi:hypothetical protein